MSDPELPNWGGMLLLVLGAYLIAFLFYQLGIVGHEYDSKDAYIEPRAVDDYRI